MGLHRLRCVFVGDSGIDMQTATNAAMFPVGATWGFRSREELIAAGAKALVERPEEIGIIADCSGDDCRLMIELHKNPDPKSPTSITRLTLSRAWPLRGLCGEIFS